MASYDNNPDKIQYQVTRPIVPIIDTNGMGDYNISPLGFPVADVSGELGIAPTLVTPNFTVGYNPAINNQFTTNYTSYNTAIVAPNGPATFIETISSLAYSGSGNIINVQTSRNHGYTTGLQITISGALPIEYNGVFSITIDPIDPTKYTYTLPSPPSYSVAGGNPTSAYVATNGAIVELLSQPIPTNNGKYKVSLNSDWLNISKLGTDGLYVMANSTANVNISVGGLAPIVQNVTSLISTGTKATVTTLTAHGYNEGQSVTISGASPIGYNGTFVIGNVSAFTFSYTISGSLTSPATGTITSTYNVLENDIVNLVAQSNQSENGIYIAHASTSWDLLGYFYTWNGTENDNVEGCPVIDACSNTSTGISNHYRKGYSNEEVANYIRNKLSVPLDFGQYKGSIAPMTEQGSFIKWFLGNQKTNIGGSENNTQVWVDPFGSVNDKPIGDRNIAINPVEATNATRLQKMAKWGISNSHSAVYTNSQKTKSPVVKDYPFTYNGQSLDNDIYSGDQIDVVDDIERFQVITGPGTVSTTAAKPFAVETLYYISNNGWHNNITLDMNNANVYGRHNLSIMHNLDKIDYVEMYYVYFTDANVNTSTSTITITSTYTFYKGDYVFFTNNGGALPTGLSTDVTYIVSSTTINSITLTDLNNNPITISSASGGGTYAIHRIAAPPYRNYLIVNALDDIINNTTFVNNQQILLKVTESNVTKYLFIERQRKSIDTLIQKGSGVWSYDNLTYDIVDGNTVKIYLEETETNFIQFYHPLKTSSDIIATLLANNELIPVPFNASITPITALTELYTTNTLVDYTQTINQNAQIHSKKTFIHLPTPMNMLDGTKVEIDVSMPMVPDQDSFAYPTVGALSGYRNFVTQPRVYVFSGYQKKVCLNTSISSITQHNGIALMTLSTQLPVYIYPFAPSDVSVEYNNITVPFDFSVGDAVMFSSTGTLPTPLSTTAAYIVNTYIGGAITLITPTGAPIILLSNGTGSLQILRIESLQVTIDGAVQDGFNGTFDAIVNNFNSVTYNVDSTLPSTATGNLVLEGLSYVDGGSATSGLTERNNEQLFGSNPEISGATQKNIYHQTFTPLNIVGNGNISSPDRRVLIATAYPTASNTFAWRIDNDPTLRMLSWSMLNVHANGSLTDTGSFANVAYTRNKEIVSEYPQLLNCSLYYVPVSYNDNYPTTVYEQFINAHIRVLLEPTLGINTLSVEDKSTYGSYNYQSSLAFNQLATDFLKGRVRVNSRKNTAPPFEPDALQFAMGYNGNNGDTVPPTAFYNNFIKYTTVAYPNQSSINGNRWMTKAIYTPNYVVNAQDATNQSILDSYQGTPTALKSYLSTYFITGYPTDSNAGHRYVIGDLDPSIDPSFDFATGSNNAFVNFMIANNANATDIDDVSRRLWDSYYTIPQASDRQIQNMYQIGAADSMDDIVKFYGMYWIPFAKVFSSDVYIPAEYAVTAITDYATIIGGTVPNLYDTFANSLESNPIASRFLSDGYIQSFVSVNTVDSTNSNNELFLRNYIAGYSNLMPFRFYNNFRTVVDGSITSTSYLNDVTYPIVNTESDNQRIFEYSCADYLSQYVDNPSLDVGKFIDDNFVMRNYEYAPGTVIAEDYNASWLYFEAGNPVTEPVSSQITDLIAVSGMNYMATRNWYQTKMKYSYVRYKMSFVFSKDSGRWYCLDYRQAPISYLTPTFGNEALSYMEKSVVYPGTTGNNASDYVPSGSIAYDYLWKNPSCLTGYNNYSEVYNTPYYQMSPMTLNMHCYPYLSPLFPYDSNGNLVPQLNPNIDIAGAELYRPLKLLSPQTSINFVVPNNMYGGKYDPNLTLMAWQPNMWSVYWNMRPAVCAMDGTDIPHGIYRSGGVMADPVLNDMYSWPVSRTPQYSIPWYNDMSSNWLIGQLTLIDGNGNRNDYVEIDAGESVVSTYGDPSYSGGLYGGITGRLLYTLFNALR